MEVVRYMYICMYTCMYVIICMYVYVGACIKFSLREEEIMPFATTWIDLEYIMLIEISQTKANIV